ncbi:adenylosuccinate lyase [archaeon]|nr:adenylosuccinate lyase [archaeon]
MDIVPLTDRYYENIKELEPFTGEKALAKYRILVECKYLVWLSNKGVIRTFSNEEKTLLSSLNNITEEDFSIIKQIERKGYNGRLPVYHDVRAVEVYIKEKLNQTSLKDCVNWLHFGLTSDDTNNIAYALIHTSIINKVITPNLEQILNSLLELSKQFRNAVILGRTHGQPATTTTFGKELFNFYERIRKEKEHLSSLSYEAKLNGATGNYSAHMAAFPDVNWTQFSVDFINSFNEETFGVKLSPNLTTTQIEPHDSFARICDSLKRINTTITGLNQDIWGYISDEWLAQKTGNYAGFSYIGSSSTMPHKLNPTDFENSEGNLGLANALLEFFSRKLPISRFQRDISDSTVLRNSIIAFAYSLNAYKALLKGLSKIDVNYPKIKQTLEEHPEVITEGVQTILRSLNYDEPYEKMKELSRGKKVTLEELRAFIQTLNVPQEMKEKLLNLSPENYYGMADKFIPE